MDRTDEIDTGRFGSGLRRLGATTSLPALPDGRALLAKVEAYWRGQCAGGLPPYRRDLDAARISEALPHVILLERIAPGAARLRTAGQGICAHLGVEARGLPLSALVSAASRPRLGHWLDHCFEDPALVELAVTARRGPLRPPMAARLLLLPLRDHDGKVTRALGGIFPVAGAMLSNIRFDLREDGTLRHEPLRVRRAPNCGQAPEPRVLGLAEPRRPYLRLVVCND